MYKEQNILGIIPARGGSKGVPRKNIKLFLGKPLIVWAIEEAKKSQHIDRLIVSTDDEEIAKIAKEHGAEVPFLRPKEIAGDTATDLEFFEHALAWFKKEEEYEPNVVLRLPPTSPMRTATHIDEGIEILVNTPDADSVRPMQSPDKHPYRMWQVAEGGDFVEPFLGEEMTGVKDAHSMPRQSYPDVYAQTGVLDCIRAKTILEQKSTTGKKIAYFFMETEDTVNIDNPLDFFVAEALMNRRLGNK